jgi:hypothetical protein
MRRSRFLIFDGVGAALWAGVFVGLGLLFSDQLERLVGQVGRLGTWLAAILVGGLAVYILWKYVKRQRFLRRLRIARITPDELKRKVDAGEDVMIVDLRHSMDFEAEPHVIPGALRLSAEDLDGRHHEIPRDRDIILYCT